MRKKLNIEFDNSEIKVPFDELFYDIIFVIIISKVSSIIVEAHNITPGLIIGCLLLFGSLVWVWLFRVNQLNNIHILQKKLNDYSLKSENLTYIEILIIVCILFGIHAVNFESIFVLFIVAMFITNISFNRIRRQIITNAQTHNNFHQIHGPGRPDKFKKSINVEYVFERFGIVFVLFMGEILSISFTHVGNFPVFFVIVCLVIAMFKNNIEILKAAKDKIELESNIQLYKNTIDYAKSLLTLLLSIVVSIEASDHFPEAKYITIIILVIYYLFETRMRRAVNAKVNPFIYLINNGLILIIILGLNIKPGILIGLGLISLLSTFERSIQTRYYKYRTNRRISKKRSRR